MKVRRWKQVEGEMKNCSPGTVVSLTAGTGVAGKPGQGVPSLPTVHLLMDGRHHLQLLVVDSQVPGQLGRLGENFATEAAAQTQATKLFQDDVLVMVNG